MEAGRLAFLRDRGVLTGGSGGGKSVFCKKLESMISKVLSAGPVSSCIVAYFCFGPYTYGSHCRFVKLSC